MQIKKILFLGILSLISCENKEQINTIVYKKGNVVDEFYGTFFYTKYGGLNYYISNKNERNDFFDIKDIDSIILMIDNKKYMCKSIVSKPYSRVINNSDFSFSISEKTHSAIVDKINNMETLLFFSAKTDLEKLKDDGIIKATYLENVK